MATSTALQFTKVTLIVHSAQTLFNCYLFIR